MRHLLESSIAGKLARLNIGVSGSALLLACVGFFVYDSYSFRAELVRNLDMQSQIITSNSISAVVFDDTRAAYNTLAALRAVPHVVLAEIRTPDGRTFATYDRDGMDSWTGPVALPPGRNELHGFRKQRLFVMRLLTFDGKAIGTLCIESDLSTLKQRQRNFLMLIGTVLLVSLLTSMAISSFARRSITDPIIELSDVARVISQEKNYSVRARAMAEQNEFSGLISAFNQMLEQIQLQDVALRAAHDDLEQRVQERTAQLDTANHDLEAFSYSVSHDLRAPLRHIMGFCQVISDEHAASMEPGALKYLQKIQDRANAMSELIEALLTMARVGRTELSLRPTDLNLLLSQVKEELLPECQGRQVEWRIGQLPTVECEPGLMKQVFMNLLSNAIKYSRIREVAVIEVGQTEHDGTPVMFVRDNGAGFDPHYAGKLFGVFQRLHASREFEGTGVGLATVRRILQKHGGNIWATAAVGQGATFYFSLDRNAHPLMERRQRPA